MEPTSNEFFLSNIQPLVRQVDRIEERTRDLVTRTDLENLRKEVVRKEAFEPQLDALKSQILRTDADRAADKVILDKRIDTLEDEQINRQDRLWIRLGQILALLAFVIALLDFMSRIRFTP